MKTNHEIIERLKAIREARKRVKGLKASLLDIEYNGLYRRLPGSVRRAWDRGRA